MGISKRKLAANRANAKKSTGPRSAAGKEAVSQNRVVHGLCGQFRVLSSERQEDYDELLERFLQAEKPVDQVERELVAKMARHTWLSDRALRFQEACFVVQPQSEDQKERSAYTHAVLKDLDIYLRYQAHGSAQGVWCPLCAI
jgi:hypothetical protein